MEGGDGGAIGKENFFAESKRAGRMLDTHTTQQIGPREKRTPLVSRAFSLPPSRASRAAAGRAGRRALEPAHRERRDELRAEAAALALEPAALVGRAVARAAEPGRGSFPFAFFRLFFDPLC